VSSPAGNTFLSLPIAASGDTFTLPALPADTAARARFSGLLPAIQVTDALESVESARDSATVIQDLPATSNSAAPNSAAPSVSAAGPGTPVAVSGWLGSAGEEDRYRLKVGPESKWRFEVFAARLGAAIDSVLEVRREAGAVLATNDDVAGTTDSALDFTVPKDADTVILAVKDALSRAGESQIYRLVATPVPSPGPAPGTAAPGTAGTGTATAAPSGVNTPAGSPAAAAPDFRLVAELDRFNVAAGGRGIVRLRVDRRGYAGPIRVDLGALPASLVADGAEIPADADGKLIVLTAQGDAIGQSLTTIRGLATVLPADPNQPAPTSPTNSTTQANSGTQANSVNSGKLAMIESDSVALATPAVAASTSGIPSAAPWLSTRFAWALTTAAAVGFDTDWQPPTDANLVLGGKFSAPIVCRRPAGWDGPVRIVVLTNQNPPLVNGKDDPNRTLRAESNAPVELPADPKATAAWDAKLAADKAVADTQAAFDKAASGTDDKAKADAEAKLNDAKTKLAAAIEAANAAAAAAKNDLALPLLVPADLAGKSVEIAFRAELLSRDKQRVLQTTCTPVRSLPIVNPLNVVYAGSAPLQAKLDAKAGATVKVIGKVERRFGFAGDVSISVAGVPTGVAAPKVAVKADQTDFELELKFPANQPPGPLGGLTLFATGKMTPQATLEVRSADVAVPLELLAPTP
jgi:hypothetical protein